MLCPQGVLYLGMDRTVGAGHHFFSPAEAPDLVLSSLTAKACESTGRVSLLTPDPVPSR